MTQMTHSSSQVAGAPAWAGDFLSPEHLVPGGAKLDAAQFNATDAVIVVVGSAGAAVDATTVPVDALSGAVPSGTVLDFGGDKYATLTAAAAAGATSITVRALVTALVDNDAATYKGVGKKTVPSGTVIGRTFVERAAGTPFGPAGDSDDEIYLVAFDVTDAAINNDVELYRHSSIVKENRLPNWATLSAAVKAALRANYSTTVGA